MNEQTNEQTNERGILIAGVGNIFLGDDGFGCEVVRRLSARARPIDAHVVDFGIRGFDLAYALMEGYKLTIMVDATPRGGAPGTVYAIEPDLKDLDQFESQATTIETHAMNPMRVLAFVKSMGGNLNRIIIVGCEPETASENAGGDLALSEPVSAAVDEAIALIELLVSGEHKGLHAV